MKRLKAWANHTPLHQKLLAIFLCFGIIPIILISVVFYGISSELMLNNVISNLLSEVKKNNELISLRFERIEDVSLYLTVDENLHALMNVESPPSSLDKLHGNLEIKKIMDRYFWGIDGVFSYHMYTDYYLMAGNNIDRTISSAKPAMYVPHDYFVNSMLHQAASCGNGKLVWYPTYSYEAMYGIDFYKSIDYNYKYLFSAVKQINCIDQPFGRVAPVLIVSFLPEFFDRIIMNDTLVDRGAQYYIVSENNDIIASSETGLLGMILDPEISTLAAGKNGACQVSIHRNDCIIAYDTIDYTNWKQIILVPSHAYLSSMVSLPKIAFIFSLVLAVLLTAFLGMITHSIRLNMNIVKEGMIELGNGNFTKILPVPEDVEFGLLAKGFNQMSQRIHNLITENYEINLRQKEAQLMALNLQMNPHFLYNTLSTINWIAIENGQDEISRALTHLSQMLQRNYKNKNDVFTVEEDLKWLDDYLYIMELRFDNKFSVRIDMDEALLQTHIPRSMFQPLIENSIIHGFEDMESGEIIWIKGSLQQDGCRVFTITDNGNGFSKDMVSAILEKASSQIGLSNLNHRLKVLYHDTFSLNIKTGNSKGTEITLVLPPEDPSWNSRTFRVP